jgi:four helix bundle protein
MPWGSWSVEVECSLLFLAAHPCWSVTYEEPSQILRSVNRCSGAESEIAMSEIKTFRDLDAWNVAMELVVSAYGVAKLLPTSERFELSSQVRRAAVSIPANVAEGYACRGRRYLHHVRIALGSHAELDTLLETAQRLQLVPAESVERLRGQLDRSGQLLHGLLRSLERRQTKKVAGTIVVLLACIALSW